MFAILRTGKYIYVTVKLKHTVLTAILDVSIFHFNVKIIAAICL